MPEKRPFCSTLVNFAPTSKSLPTSSVRSLTKRILSYTCTSEIEGALQRSFRRSCALHLALTVRKFTSRHYTVDDLIARGRLTRPFAGFLAEQILRRQDHPSFVPTRSNRPSTDWPIWSYAIQREPLPPTPSPRSGKPSIMLYISSCTCRAQPGSRILREVLTLGGCGSARDRANLRRSSPLGRP
jgi:hypothetical protein